MDLNTFNTLLYIWIALALLLLPVQIFITAPYGRHASSKWGPQIDNRLGWIIMEIVSPAAFALLFLLGSNPKSTPMWIFFFAYVLHYLNRSLIFPLRIRTNGKKMPLFIIFSAISFNLVNGSTNGYWLGSLGAPYPEDWLHDPRFIIGLGLFISGAFINIQSDNILLRLRKPGETGYKIPQGGLFRFISCPNHFGEIIEWAGFALMCWNLPALGFAVWTAANLIPRAIAHHKWYQQRFDNYPTERKAVVPGIV